VGKGKIRGKRVFAQRHEGTRGRVPVREEKIQEGFNTKTQRHQGKRR
jgi:hypothetical protein